MKELSSRRLTPDILLHILSCLGTAMLIRICKSAARMCTQTIIFKLQRR